MSREIEKIAEDLFEKIRSRFEGVNLGDQSAKATADPEKARFFNFNYTSKNGDEFGNVTISIIDENSLKIYFGRNISEKLDDEQRKEWFSFLHDLRYFAKRNLLTFDTRDISRSNLHIKDLKQQAKSDTTLSTQDVTMNESRLYGTAKTSFENIGSARLRIIHTESVNPEQRGARSRHINAIYVENAHGERFKLEHNKLSGARAMARHISEGGIPYDDVGQHINGMILEMSELGRFVRVMRNRTFEDSTATTMVEAATNYYHGMNRQLNHLKSTRAYKTFVENFTPQAQQLDEVDLNGMKERFVKKIFDDRMTAALPHVYKAYQLHEQAKQQQINTVRDVVENRLPLKLIANEGMDEYIRALNFSHPNELVVKVLEDIAERALAAPEISEFAKHWAANYTNVTENSDQTIRENQALAVKLATHYLKDLRNLKEGLRIQATEINYVDFDSGSEIMEGTWALPESPEDLEELKTLMANPLPVGNDAENATSALYNLIGDDELFDRLGDLSDNEGPKADARDVIKHFMKQEMPGLMDRLGLSDDAEMDQDPAQQQTPGETPLAGAPATAAPPPPPAPTAAPGTDEPVVAEDIARLLKLSGLQSFLVK
jgi:hypothetical protein